MWSSVSQTKMNGCDDVTRGHRAAKVKVKVKVKDEDDDIEDRQTLHHCQPPWSRGSDTFTRCRHQRRSVTP